MTFITPKDLYLLCVIGLINLATQFPGVGVRLLFAKIVALSAYHFSQRKRRLSEKSVSEVFQGRLNEDHTRNIVKGSFYHFWLDIFSLPYGCSGATLPPHHIQGLEHLHDSLERGNGAILWESSYFGRRNFAKHILFEKGFAIDQIHTYNHTGGFGGSRDRQSWVRKRVIGPYFDRCERAFLQDIIYLGDRNSLTFTRTLVNRLKNNGILCISADGTRGQKFISAPVLGRPHLFPTGILNLARFTGTPILPLFCYVDKKERTSLVILPPLKVPSGLQREDALENGVQQFAAQLESYVRTYPEQYRRWDSSTAS